MRPIFRLGNPEEQSLALAPLVLPTGQNAGEGVKEEMWKFINADAATQGFLTPVYIKTRIKHVEDAAPASGG